MTSWTRCLSERPLAPYRAVKVLTRTDVDKNRAVLLLVDNVVLEDLLIKSSGSLDGAGHFEQKSGGI